MQMRGPKSTMKLPKLWKLTTHLDAFTLHCMAADTSVHMCGIDCNLPRDASQLGKDASWSARKRHVQYTSVNA